MPYALAGLDDQEQALISVLTMMVSHGAHGLSVDETVLKTLKRPGPATEDILMVLLPVGIGPVASGKAVLALSRQAATVRSLELLCETSDIPETPLASALKIVLGHKTLNMEKARILAETIERLAEAISWTSCWFISIETRTAKVTRLSTFSWQAVPALTPAMVALWLPRLPEATSLGWAT